MAIKVFNPNNKTIITSKNSAEANIVYDPWTYRYDLYSLSGRLIQNDVNYESLIPINTYCSTNMANYDQLAGLGMKAIDKQGFVYQNNSYMLAIDDNNYLYEIKDVAAFPLKLLDATHKWIRIANYLALDSDGHCYWYDIEHSRIELISNSLFKYLSNSRYNIFLIDNDGNVYYHNNSDNYPVNPELNLIISDSSINSISGSLISSNYTNASGVLLTENGLTYSFETYDSPSSLIHRIVMSNQSLSTNFICVDGCYGTISGGSGGDASQGCYGLHKNGILYYSNLIYPNYGGNWYPVTFETHSQYTTNDNFVMITQDDYLVKKVRL